MQISAHSVVTKSFATPELKLVRSKPDPVGPQKSSLEFESKELETEKPKCEPDKPKFVSETPELEF